jgi:chromosome segregation ATPase
MRHSCIFALAAATALDEATHPVVKVVNMLKTMKQETQEEGEKDKELFEKMQCWCRTGRANKETSIKDGAERISALEADIEADTATVAKLENEIDSAKKGRADNKDSLSTAESMREKENSEYSKEAEDLKTSIGQLDGAIESIEKNFGADGSTLLQVRDIVRTTASKYKNMLDMDLDGIVGDLDLSDVEKQQRDRELALAELFAPQKLRGVSALNQQPANFKSYNSQSGKILGVLKQMKEGMEKNLAEAVANENSAQSNFDGLKASLLAEVNSQNQQVEDDTSSLADTRLHLENAKHDKETTTDARDADTEFLADLEKKCASSEAEYNARVKDRNQEIEALGTTLNILTSDQARELFHASLDFAQVSQHKHSTTIAKKRREAVAMLQGAIRKSNSVALMSLMVSIKIDSFTKVEKSMDELVAELKAQTEDDLTKKESCEKDIQVDNDNIKEANFQRNKEENKISDLETTVEDLTDAINKAQEEIDVAQTSVKRSGENRAAENKEYQQTVADQRATLKILQFALSKLEEVYGKYGFMQQPASGEALSSPPEAGTRAQHGDNNQVMSLMQSIITDTKMLEQESISDENDAQEEYEKLLTDSFSLIDRNRKDIVGLKERRAVTKDELATWEQDLGTTKAELDQLSKESADLHAECDFLLNNFELRKAARTEEIESIKTTKALLEGAYQSVN